MKTLNAKLFEKRKQENKLVAKFPGKKNTVYICRFGVHVMNRK